MSFAQVNHDAWDILSATPRYTALKTMRDNCNIVHDEQGVACELNLASRIMMPHQFPTTGLKIQLPLPKV